ncbi:glucokinase [Umezakia ovalisporum]|jgi:glucokinase|uniref:Glucokinase n=2 Tax=Umezakia ovalisporum TaxID=75695 RepID=A0AA43KEG4_9CYAN|nr:glucokinase [Umezakia ovalisporum]MBI1241626.1 glucokinase [Nostoc sp. RI_552]MDH6057354.1 glucokinase [Umezakia ovalisporum FSS-43]MDH6063581.1 glucokinase [Umezakia ovalisporum FSS-62]MDH6072506.1 glucokinase [Umezakia ovalisporum CobakiLakeA]MDH6075571.1 glucokinase [Umezakia ovalisporum CS-1034]
MTLLLAGDIGGTKTILRLVEVSNSLDLQTVYEETYRSGDFLDLVPLVQQFLSQANTPVPQRACFAIAGPVVNNTAKLTNLTWFIDTERLKQELSINSMCLINDFAAVGYGIFGLSKQDLLTLQPGKLQPEAPIGIIGAGTGLGQGFLIKQGNYYQVFPSEGGHADFAPRSELEFQILKYLLDKHNIQRVSVERVVSGQGIVAIYQFLRDRKLSSESPEIAQIVRTWEQEAGQQEKTVDPGAAIGKAALEGSDRLSLQTLELFVDIYGAEAGNLALKLLPYGGLYIAGGIAPKILPLIQKGTFLLNFSQKGRMRPLMEDIPVHIILNQQVGLIGAALRAARL